MSARCAWTSGCSDSSLPNCRRRGDERRAPRRARAAPCRPPPRRPRPGTRRASRSASFMPCPTSPIRADAGSATPRSSSAPIGCAAIAASGRTVTPGASSGSQNAVSPRVAARRVDRRDHHRVVGDPEVRDEQLVAVEPVAVGGLGRPGRDRRDVRAGLGLGQRERRDPAAARERRQLGALLRRARGPDRVRPQPLAHEDRVGARRHVAQHLARQAHRAQVDRRPGRRSARGTTSSNSPASASAATAARSRAGIVGVRPGRFDRRERRRRRAQPLGQPDVGLGEEHRQVIARQLHPSQEYSPRNGTASSRCRAYGTKELPASAPLACHMIRPRPLRELQEPPACHAPPGAAHGAGWTQRMREEQRAAGHAPAVADRPCRSLHG